MANKTMMVAAREYIENIRTKTFWVGILMFPVVWAAALFIPALLTKAKGVQKYAIVDQTEDAWFTKKFNEETETPDLAKLYGDWKSDSVAKLPERLVKTFTGLRRGEEKAGKTREAGQVRRAFDGYSMVAGVTDEQIAQVAPFLPALSAILKRLPDALLEKVLSQPGSTRAELEKILESGAINADSLREMRDEAKGFLADARAWWLRMGKSADEEERKVAKRYRSVSTLSKYARVAPDTEDALLKRVDNGELFAFFVVPKNPVGVRPSEASKKKAVSAGDGNAAAEPKKDKAAKKSTDFRYVSKKESLADDGLKKWFRDHAKAIIRKERIKKVKLNEQDASWLASGVRFKATMAKAGGGGEEKVEAKDVAGQYAPIIFVYLLWISVFTIANLLLTNTIEEKSNRLIEVLLSSVSPLQLMMGKIFGLAATGLTMVGSWAIFAVLGIKLAPLFGDSIADLGLNEIILNPRYLGSFLIYFVFGYLLYAALLVGIGSVCNSLKEAQNLMQPVIILLIVPLLAMFPIAQEPNGTMAKVMSYIPPFTPFVMMNRAGGPPSMLEYGATTVLLIVTVGAAIIFAAKIFRIGILMTAKPPKVREIFGWLKAPVGTVYVREDD